jgi:sugar O-acyltransferase (sialic acid O-acetyltransferase NeuD family)
MSLLIGIYGASGCGRSIMPLARKMDAFAAGSLVFVDDALNRVSVNGYPVFTFEDFQKLPGSQKRVAIAIADPEVRMTLAARVLSAGIELASIRSDMAIFLDDVDIAEGALISPFVTFTSNIRIGRCFHANLYSYVEHDCKIGDFVTFAPGVCCNGNVSIGDGVYVGSGATIRQGLNIGAGATIGMGAVVTKDVSPGITVAGNPARLLEKIKDA